MKALERALVVEAALSEAREKGKMGRNVYYTDDDVPVCTMGHASRALGCDMRYAGANTLRFAFGIKHEHRFEFIDVIADVQNRNDDYTNSQSFTDAAQILVNAIKEFGVDDDDD